jgi:hypothetical protein
MKRVEIILKTTFNEFAAWLARHTEDVYGKSFPTEAGWVSLEAARPPNTFGDTRFIQMLGHYAMLDKDGNAKSYLQGAMIQFEVLRLSQERIEVQVTCSQPVLMSYFDNLLSGIARHWPEAQIEDVPMQLPPRADTVQTSELIQPFHEEQKQKTDESDSDPAPALKGSQDMPNQRRPPGPKPGVLNEFQKDRVRRYLEARANGMSQKSFCAEEGIERSTLRRWETAMKKSNEL